ncbi:spermine oxidase [Zeugodacus cucurbitae]|uniref:spermine oxidase n=1 Tax=Zeugodacus cucurbitae TaxID=28588 RepID=UPI0023D8F730|nr:spermine oxidase [Zeugodacus cucurbitae]
MKSKRVVIIGAGAAGVAAATRLLESGFENVLLLEAENRFGGRIHTIPFADNVIDLGAQWCHGEQGNAIYELTRGLDMLRPSEEIEGGFKCIRSNKEVVDDAVVEKLRSIILNLEPTHQDGLKDYEGSLGAYITDAFWRKLEALPDIDRVLAREFFENGKKKLSSMDGADNLFEVSGKGQHEYLDCEGDLHLYWKGKGFGSFLRLLMKANQDDPSDLGLLNEHIKYNARVEHIDWQSSKGDIRLRLWNGELILADHVICTVSLGVLKDIHQKLFTPTLPLAKCRAIDGLSLGTVDKFFLEFKQPFAPLNWAGFSFLWQEEDLAELRNSGNYWLESVFNFQTVSNQPRLLQGWILGPHARHMETLAEAEVLDALLWLFNKFLTFEVPTPVRFLRTRWYTNPNFRGSYSFRSVYTDELRTSSSDMATPILDERDGKPLLQFAGEATHPHFYSTAHGAVESGWREAQRLIAHYQEHNSHSQK